MRICITGGAGMIGSNLVRRLVQDNHQVKVIDNLWRGNLENLKVNGQELININRDFYNLDLNNPLNLQEIKNIIQDVDIVIHLADIVAGIGYVFNKQYEIFTLNNSINTNLFKAASESCINKLVYVGTACSFPLELQNSLDSELNEKDLYPANPESAYGWSKLIGQLELKYLSETVDFEINTLILHNVYGPNCEFEGERTQVIPSLINRVIETKKGGSIEVWGSGSQGRAFVHVEDVTKAIYGVLNKSNLPEYMQIGPNYCTSIKELIEMLIKISGKDLKINFDTTKPEGDKGRFANYTLAKEAINWYPTIELYDGLEETYKWIETQKKKK